MRNQNHFDMSKFNTQNQMATKTGRRMRSTHAVNRIDQAMGTTLLWEIAR
jgi:hypothetical protein